MMSKATGKGFALEELLRAYFWEAGYFAVRGVPFNVGSLEVTDVDLWLYERPAAAARRRMIVDVKNKKRSKAVERIVWAKGLAQILGVENAIVAAKDARPETELLAKKAGVKFFGSSALSRIQASKKLETIFALSEDEFIQLLQDVDSSRRSKDWKNNFDRLRTSLLDGLGEGSLNKAISAFGYFAQQAIEAPPRSKAAEVAVRLSNYASSMILLNIDFLLADLNFLSPEDRAKAIENAIRFGAIGGKADLSSVKVGLGLISTYAPNGRAMASEVERKFDADAASIPGKIIGEFITKLKVGGVFPVARELHAAAYASSPAIDASSSVEARASIGALLDFHELDRRSFAAALDEQTSTSGSGSGSDGGLNEQSMLDLDQKDKSN